MGLFRMMLLAFVVTFASANACKHDYGARFPSPLKGQATLKTLRRMATQIDCHQRIGLFMSDDCSSTEWSHSSLRFHSYSGVIVYRYGVSRLEEEPTGRYVKNNGGNISALTMLVRAPEDELRQICDVSVSLGATERSANRSFSSCHQRPDSNNVENFENSTVSASNPKEASITATSTTLLAFIFLLVFGYGLPLVVKGLNRTQAIGFKSFDDQSKPMQHRPRNARNSFFGIKRLGSVMSPLGSSMFPLFLLGTTAVLLLIRPMEATQDLRESIINGTEPCFAYAMEEQLFYVNCSVVHWQAQGYGSETYISLGANETFDGVRTVDNTKSYIDLDGIINFEGLLAINDNEVITFAEAPLIRNIHVKNGRLSSGGGYIVRKEQKFFIIESCSSTGEITIWAGGICGYLSGQNSGKIEVRNSYSTGKITGKRAGGIAAKSVGYNGGIVHITQCHSTGNIEGRYAGGISGADAGDTNGQVYMKQSYSTGEIVSGADYSGGIVAEEAGYNKGYVHIQECYSTGRISAGNSGGIAGCYAAQREGEVHIIDCYTRGDIDAPYAGGITGYNTGGTGDSRAEMYGDVYITNTYASGIVKHAIAGGIIGDIRFNFRAHTISIQYSVYNKADEGKIIGQTSTHLEESGNSDNLDDIQGKLYHYDGKKEWENDNWVINGTDTLPIFRFQLRTSSSPSPTPAKTSKDSMLGTTSIITLSGILSFLVLASSVFGTWYCKKKRSGARAEAEVETGVEMNSRMNPLAATQKSIP